MADFSGISSEQLRQFIKRVENLEKEKADIMETIKEAYNEAKSQGFDVPVMKQIIKNRKMDREKLAEQEELMSVYMTALGESEQPA
jgi:uncharacterized protein (UPF0335 family)